MDGMHNTEPIAVGGAEPNRPLRVVVVLALVSITFHWVNNFWYFETRALFDKLGECWSYPVS